VIWDLTDQLRVRATALQTRKPQLVVNQSVEPTHVAGFNQFFDDFNGTDMWRYGIGIDATLDRGLYAGTELSRRDGDVPSFLFNPSTNESAIVVNDVQETLFRAYVYWAPTDRVATRGSLELDDFSSNSKQDITDLETFAIGLSARYFMLSGLFANGGLSLVHQSIGDASNEDDGAFFVIDAAVGFRFPDRVGVMSLEGRNLLDQRFDYQDDSFRSTEPVLQRFLPDRSVLFRLTLSF
jgi:hypothetical protein